MNDYELMVVVSPRGGEDGFPQTLSQVSQLIETHGGVIATTMTNPPWGHRRLAYPIQDFRDAYYGVIHLRFDPARVVGFERELRLLEPVIRYIVVRRDDAMRAEAKAATRRPVAVPAAPEEAEGDDDGDEGLE